MKLSISNIGWDKELDNQVYDILKNVGYEGLEIAPTRIFPDTPYDALTKANIWSEDLKKEYQLTIASMQSIWYGRNEKIFGSNEERQSLIDYTKKAIDFAASIGCGNLVFGCPRNRSIEDESQMDIAVEFFKELGDYAFKKGTCIGMEANPPMYNTNFINDTESAIELIKRVNSEGFLLNLDIGTIIANEEKPEELVGNVKYINHVHISEPGLKPIEKRELHKEIKEILQAEGYKKFVSIEMGRVEDISLLQEKIAYIKNVFK